MMEWKERNLVALLVVAVSCVMGTAWATLDDPLPTDPAWDVDYRGEVLPAAAGWVNNLNSYGGSQLQVVGDEAYHQTYCPSGGYMQFTYDWSAADMSNGVTVETRAKAGIWGGTLSMDTTGYQLASVGVGDQYAYMRIQGNPSDASLTRWLGLSGATADYYYLDTTQWHTYRMTIEGTTANVYVDNDLTPVLSVQTGSSPGIGQRIAFGNGSYGPSCVGDLDYIRGYGSGAVAPVPEPATMILLGLGALVLRKRS